MASITIFAALILLLFFLVVKFNPRRRRTPAANLPPGSVGWPLIGETFEFLRANRDGEPERFVRDRMRRHDSRVFRTSLLGENVAVLCGPAGNKFLFGNENKVVRLWWPASVQKLLGRCLTNTTGDEAKHVRRTLMNFMGPDALIRYISAMDAVTQRHFNTHWEDKEELEVYPTLKSYTFKLACHLFAGIEDPESISILEAQFYLFLKGVISIPLKLPGTRFSRAMRAADVIRKQLRFIIRQRIGVLGLEQKKTSPSQDLLTHLLETPVESGRFMPEEEIINNILTLLFAAHDTSTSYLTVIMKYLADLPQVYDKVFKEQMDIADSKVPGESVLQWEDIQKMRYTWNVVCEVGRLIAPISGSYREAITDFTYEGYTIPKGWKLYWSAAATHKDPMLFPAVESFDASRFEEAAGIITPFSYVPFGGGPRMCLGQEYARLEILVFLHYLVKKFKWELLIPNEKIEYDPMPTPVKGLAVRLRPHKTKI